MELIDEWEILPLYFVHVFRKWLLFFAIECHCFVLFCCRDSWRTRRTRKPVKAAVIKLVVSEYIYIYTVKSRCCNSFDQWRRLHRTRGHFYKWLGTEAPFVEQQTRNWANCTDRHKSVHQNDYCTFRPKSGGARRNIFQRIAPDGSPFTHFQIRSVSTAFKCKDCCTYLRICILTLGTARHFAHPHHAKEVGRGCRWPPPLYYLKYI